MSLAELRENISLSNGVLRGITGPPGPPGIPGKKVNFVECLVLDEIVLEISSGSRFDDRCSTLIHVIADHSHTRSLIQSVQTS